MPHLPEFRSGPGLWERRKRPCSTASDDDARRKKRCRQRGRARLRRRRRRKKLRCDGRQDHWGMERRQEGNKGKRKESKTSSRAVRDKQRRKGKHDEASGSPDKVKPSARKADWAVRKKDARRKRGENWTREGALVKRDGSRAHLTCCSRGKATQQTKGARKNE